MLVITRIVRNTSEVFQKQYSSLVNTLPMNDQIFMEELFANGLLPGNLRNEIQSLDTLAQKATKFLEDVIKPAVTNNGDNMLNTLLTIMRNSDKDNVIQLAERIHTMINTTLSSSSKAGNYILSTVTTYVLLSDNIATGGEGDMMVYKNSYSMVYNELATDIGMYVDYIMTNYK